MKSKVKLKALLGHMTMALCWHLSILLLAAGENPEDDNASSANVSSIPVNNRGSRKSMACINFCSTTLHNKNETPQPCNWSDACDMNDNRESRENIDGIDANQDAEGLTFGGTTEDIDEIKSIKETLKENPKTPEASSTKTINNTASNSDLANQVAPVSTAPEPTKKPTKHVSPTQSSHKEGSKSSSSPSSPQKTKVSVRGAVASTFNQIGKETGVVVQQTKAATQSHGLLRFVFVMVLLSVVLVIVAMLSNTNFGGWMYSKSTEIFRRRHKELKDGVRSGSVGGDITWEWLKSAPDDHNRFSSRIGGHKSFSRLQ